MTKPVINIAEIPLRSLTHGEGFAAQLGRIGPLIGAKKLGCQLHIVPPGKKALRNAARPGATSVALRLPLPQMPPAFTPT